MLLSSRAWASEFTSWPVLTKVRSRLTRGAIQVKSLCTIASRGTGKASVSVWLPPDSNRRAHDTNTTSPSSVTSRRTALTSSTANPGLASSSWAIGSTSLVKTLRRSAPLTGYDPRTRRQSAKVGRAILPSNTVMVAHSPVVCPQIFSTDLDGLICKLPLVLEIPCVAVQRITSWLGRGAAGGMVRPRSFAVFRLITSSKVVGCSTGRSAGLAPLRILST